MMEWINHYLSATYEDGARGPLSYDCWGLVREARHLHCEKALMPSFGEIRNTQPREFTAAYCRGSLALETCEPEHGAIASVLHGRVCVHVALIVQISGELKVLEINPERGPRLIRLTDWARDHLRVTFHRDRQ